MPKIKIDNQKIDVPEGATVLQAARQLGIDIPTLCYHEALGPYGSCRLCMVELSSGGRRKLMTACTYPAWDGLEVKTGTDEVIKARRFIIELLLARCPDSPEVREVAGKLGVKAARFRGLDKDEKCILCGNCVRVCRDMIGKSAISFVNRGMERVVRTPFDEESSDCIGCGACAFVCPTGVIKVEDVNGRRRLVNWHTEFKLVKCKNCGRDFTTEAVIKRIKEKMEVPDEVLTYCLACKSRKLSGELGKLIQTK